MSRTDEDSQILRKRMEQVHSDHPLLLLLSTNLGMVSDTSSERDPEGRTHRQFSRQAGVIGPP